MKDDVISRQDVIDVKAEFLNEHVIRDTEAQTLSDRSYAKGWNECNCHWIDAIKSLPSAQPERKTGKWVYKTTDAYIQRTCSACGWSERMYHRNRNQDGLIRNYCPNCGADMRGEPDD